jgi:hypothetical protein
MGVVSPDLDVFQKETNPSVWNASGRDGRHLVRTKAMVLLFKVGFVVQETISVSRFFLTLRNGEMCFLYR